MSSQDKKKMFDAQIITLGEGKVGKTSLIYRYIDNTFTLNYLSTIGIDSKVKKIKLKNGEDVKVKLFDTAGQERFKSITTNYIKKANGILLVYDITDETSFKKIEAWYQNLSSDSNNILPIVLIGNKSDLEEERVVSTEDGEELAQKLKIENHFFETSCQSGKNVHEAINDLVQQIYDKFGNNENQSFEIKHDNNKKDKKDKKGKKENSCC
jgi:small GTP-binding protein